MTRLMFDSDQPEVLIMPAKAGVRVATYADLLTPDLIAELGPMLAAIDRGQGDPHGVATIADIEPGLLSVADGAAKIREWTAQRRSFPTAYHDRALWEEVKAALAGVSYYEWIATLDGTCSPDGTHPSLVQVLGAAQVGFHADLSIIWDDRWHPGYAVPTPAQVADVKSAMSRTSGFMAQLEHAVGLLLHAVQREAVHL